MQLLETPAHTPQDITTLVDAAGGPVAFTHLWWGADGPAEDPHAPDPALLHRNRARILGVARKSSRATGPRSYPGPARPGDHAPWGATALRRRCAYLRGRLRSPEIMKAKLTYTGIRVKDLDASVRFYTNVLGMKEIDRSTIDVAKGRAVNLVSEDGGHPLELNYYEKGSPFASKYEAGEGLDHLAFRVENLDAAIAEAKGAGHPVIKEMKTATSRWVYIQDPNGIWIELFQ